MRKTLKLKNPIQSAIATTIVGNRFVASKALISKNMEKGFYWHKVPQNIDAKKIIEYCQQSSKNGSKPFVQRLSPFDIQHSMPTNLSRDLWLFKKKCDEMIRTIALRQKIDLLTLDSMLHDSSRVGEQFTFIGLRNKMERPPISSVFPGKHILSVFYSHDPLLKLVASDQVEVLKSPPNCLGVLVGPNLTTSQSENKFLWNENRMNENPELPLSGFFYTIYEKPIN